MTHIEIPQSEDPATIRQGETHVRSLELSRGDFLRVVVEQDGIDLQVRLVDSTGEEQARVDSPYGRSGPEELVAIAPESGFYCIEVVSGDREDKRVGRYVYTSETPRPAGEAEHAWVDADRRFHTSRRLIRTAPEQAAAGLEPLVNIWRRLGLRRREAETLLQLGKARSGAAAVESCERAVLLFRKLDVPRRLAVALQEIGPAYLRLGEQARAVEALEEALTLFDALGEERGVIATLSFLGTAYRREGRLQHALDLLAEARRRNRALEAVDLEALILTETADTLLSLHRASEAFGHYSEAAKIFRRTGRRRNEAVTLTKSASAAVELDDLDEAERVVRSALELQLDDARVRAIALNTYGRVLQLQGKLDQARRAYENGLELTRKAKDPYEEAILLTSLGHLFVEHGEAHEGLLRHDEALKIFEQQGNPRWTATSRVRGAEALRELGRLDEAFERLAPALNEIDNLRAATRRQDFRLSYYAFRQNYFDIALDLLMRLAQDQPKAGHEERALHLHDRRTARELLDNVLAEHRAELVLGQEELYLDGDSLALVYALAEPRSHLWVVSGEGIETYSLEGRNEIETAARSFTRQMRKRGEHNAERRSHHGGELSRLVLGPLADRLTRQRLVIVADGALRTVPFTALPPPAPATGATYMIELHEVVTLPSLTFLASLRRRATERPAPPRQLAVFADPVFEPEDPRLEQRHHSGDAAQAHPWQSRFTPSDELQIGLERLPASRKEANAILKIVGRERVRLTMGFDADRDAFSRLAGTEYSVLHFATHALLHPEAELSGLMLSRFDESGRRRNGFLRTFEISHLDLPVDLVVLSACETARGEDLKGEGTLGLTWAFLSSGAARVIASLWKVSDERTAELMTAFYEAWWKEGRTPSAALRQAQLQIARQEGAEPWDWAGFVFQGEWRQTRRPGIVDTVEPDEDATKGDLR